MKSERAIKLLNDRINEAEDLELSTAGPVKEWRLRAARTLRAVFPGSELITAFTTSAIGPGAYVSGPGLPGPDMPRYRLRGINESCAPGCGCPRRTITRVPGG
ncbi:hypothetical protein GCM10023175_04250 [Pseudonocardia xishanensis]|uniref:Uncharacterized protein n=1 Tax=Pseudonocardia xishanensis TaxID=630995 RepID=A0ABP8RES5_9PSEU